jgi:hypothetical protein
VKVLTNVGNADCFTPDGELPAWAALTRPSGARLSNSTGLVTGDQNPCLAPPSAGYKGLENQLYRVEIHRGGPQASATFKWSRDNATVATGVRKSGRQSPGGDSLGRDDVLGFYAGEWLRILDDWHSAVCPDACTAFVRATASMPPRADHPRNSLAGRPVPGRRPGQDGPGTAHPRTPLGPIRRGTPR